MFVTINAKHTRLTPRISSRSRAGSCIATRAGRRARLVRALNDRKTHRSTTRSVARCRQRPASPSPARAGAQEAVRLGGVGAGRKGDALEKSKKFFVNYLKQTRAGLHRGVERTEGTGLRARRRAARVHSRLPPTWWRRLDQEHADRTEFRAIGRVIAPWGRRIGDLRFETEGAWKRSGTTVDSLAKELRLALQYPEGAAV